jgi:predicted HTH transcriptional regulator
MANTNGGFILLGVRNDGIASGVDVTPFANIDPAKITDKLYAYTGTHFDKFHLSTEDKDGKQIAVIQIEEAENILVFRNPGNYIDSQGKQKSAFTAGTIYVRHGAKSEPCTAEDLIGIARPVRERSGSRTGPLPSRGGRDRCPSPAGPARGRTTRQARRL